MVVGTRNETIREKNIRHIEEMKSDITGWERELEFAKSKNDEEYVYYCNMMIKICNNTKAQLEKILR